MITVREKMTQDEYLGLWGLASPISDYMLDKMRHPHGLTLRQRKKLEKDAAEAARDYAVRRQSAIAEYRMLVAAGEVIEKSDIEATVERARYGHPDNASTQAARRVCEKRGIQWDEEAQDEQN